ncbi:Ded_cyto domain-containing protein [Naegleria gruberi]|uniref:Ded_cyto domain-containing protein n=1 Tax=Naegleria gruberi TaxID=5762 RepID=D2V7S2_NAEGR|nr:Ded_cyto domain-containing protein [Naegleria gruberi]EFC46922.1 Ded_cyto domain-containing protein [Naegleria gruberi]|eukprot:XP_002679666.1 Ded_cyto domain-containing protein [Naegleria gruberi strain NEG-M]
MSSTWKRVPENTLGTVLYSRASEGRYQITLNKGDRVRVQAKKDGWLLVELIDPFEEQQELVSPRGGVSNTSSPTAISNSTSSSSDNLEGARKFSIRKASVAPSTQTTNPQQPTSRVSAAASKFGGTTTPPPRPSRPNPKSAAASSQQISESDSPSLEQKKSQLLKHIVRIGIYPEVLIRLDSDQSSPTAQNEKSRKLPTFEQAVEFSENPLAREILQVIREWSSELIKLKNENMMEEYYAVKRQMAILVGLRKKITDYNFQKDADENQKEEISQKVIKVIEEGSRKLNLDLIVRVNDGPQKGQRANESNTSVIDLFNQYMDVQDKEDIAKRNRKVREELKHLRSQFLSNQSKNNATTQLEQLQKKENDLVLKLDSNFPINDPLQRARLRHELPRGNVHLLLNVEACMFTFGEDAEIFFSVYNYTEKRYITEDFAYPVTPLGMPRDTRLITNTKTLFADISESQYLQELYLVVKIYRKGKMLFDMKANTKKTGLPPMGSGMMMASASADDIEEETSYRRPFCCTLMPITPEVIAEHMMDEREFQPGTLVLYTTPKEDLFSKLPDIIIEGGGPIERIPQDKAIGIGISLKLFNKPLDKVLEENKDTLSMQSQCCITKCIDLPTSFHPKIDRNDMYITFTRGKFLETRNVKIMTKVYSNSTKNTIQCIDRYQCLFKTPFTHYHSSILYHVPNPNWNETFKMSLSQEALLNSVLVIMLSNCTAKKKQLTERFGVAFLNLKDDLGMVSKGENDTGIIHVPVHKYIKDMEKNIFEYVNSPSKLAPTKDYIVIKLKLSSTQMTQDATLDTFIRWETKQYPTRLILDNFSKLPLSTIAPYCKVVCNTLFDILTRKNDSETSKSVFETLLSLANKLVLPENAEHLAMFKQYIADCFEHSDPEIHKCFLECLISNLENFDEEDAKESSEQDAVRDKVKTVVTIVKETLLGLPLVLLFITKNRRNYEKENLKGGLSNEDYFKTVKEVFEKISRVISITSCQKLFDAQDQLIKLLSPFILNVNEEFPTAKKTNIATLVKDFIESIPNTGRLDTVEGKLGLIRQCCSSDLLKSRETRTVILPMILNQVEKQKAVSNSLSRRVCSGILADVLATIQRALVQRNDSYTEVKKDMYLFLTKLPYIRTMFNELARESEEAEGRISRFGKRDDLESFQEHREYERIQQTRAQLFSVVLCIFYLTDFDMIQEYFQRDFTDDEKLLIQQYKDEDLHELAHTDHSKETGMKRKVLPKEDAASRVKAKRVSDIFELIESMIDHSPIPEYWIAFNVFAYHSIMKTIENFSEYLQKHHVRTFDPKLWNRLFDLYYRFALCPRLQIEKFSLSKQTKFNLHGDLRVDCVILFRKVFESLSTEHQYYFVPDLIDRVLRLAASIPKQEIYVQTLNIYYNILKLEFQSEKSLKHTQGLTAVVFDEFIVNDRLTDDKFKEFFVEVLDERFEKDELLKTDGKQFMNHTKRFMELVASVKRFTDDQEDQKTSALLRVMQYVASTQQEEIYFKYIHMLAKNHEINSNFIEAGMSILRHAEKLSFTVANPKLLPALSQEYPEEPEFRRKEKLYHQAMRYFDLGKDWERAIKLSRELAPIYETQTFEYKKLAELLKSQSEWFSKIFDQKRFFASYFFVGYYGKGFEPYGLQNKEYVYRGNEAERLVDFTERITKRFPNAEMLQPLEDAPEEKKQADGQYIRIITVYPSSYKEIETKCTTVAREMTVSKNITSYESFNDIKVFKMSKTYKGHPKDKKINEIRDLFTDFIFFIIDSNQESAPSHHETSFRKSISYIKPMPMVKPSTAASGVGSASAEDVEIMMTGDAFPTIVRRKNIISRKQAVLNPIENAIKNIEDKNVDLNELVLNHMVDTKPDTKQLSMSLNGTIDAAVHGGINKYIDAFFVPDWIQENPQEIHNVKRLQRALAVQLEVLEKGLEMYRKFGSAQTKAHVDHLCVMHNNMKEQLAETISFDYAYYLTEEYKKKAKE